MFALGGTHIHAQPVCGSANAADNALDRVRVYEHTLWIARQPNDHYVGATVHLEVHETRPGRRVVTQFNAVAWYEMCGTTRK